MGFLTYLYDGKCMWWGSCVFTMHPAPNIIIVWTEKCRAAGAILLTFFSRLCLKFQQYLTLYPSPVLDISSLGDWINTHFMLAIQLPTVISISNFFLCLMDQLRKLLAQIHTGVCICGCIHTIWLHNIEKHHEICLHIQVIVHMCI